MSILSNHVAETYKRLFVGLLASLVLSAPFALGPARAQVACGVPSGDWISLDAPPFPTGGRALVDFAVSPPKPSLMYATNGDVLVRSTDGGCSWRQSYEPGAGAVPVVGGASATIEGVVAAESLPTRAYLITQDTAGAVARPNVLRTDQAGATWLQASTGLPPAGAPAFLRIAPSDADTAYLTIAVQGVVELLYGTNNGGTTWTLRSNFGQGPGSAISDVKVDPLDPNDIWVATSSGLYRSTDGGRSFAPIQEFVDIPTDAVDVFRSQGSPASILGFTAGGALVSDDGGENWLKVDSRGQVTSVAHGQVSQSRLMSASGKVWVYLPNLFSWVDARAPRANVRGLQSSRVASPGFYGFTDSTIELYAGPVGSSVKIPPTTVVIPDLSLLDPEDPVERPAKLTPQDRVIKIDAGDSKEVPYRLEVPKSRTPLDVYFLVDTSSSQTKFLAGMVKALEGIINGLIGAGVDVQFGMAEYRNYPHSDPPRLGQPGTPCAGGAPASCYETNFVYRQVQDIAPTVAGIELALENVDAGGGGHYNAQAAALLHTAIPDGEDVEPIGPSHTDVEPNTNATFRKNALRVAVIVSDEEFIYQALEDDRTPPDLPQRDEVVAALNAKDIKQVGISLKYRGTAKATADMVDIAEATGATAPPGGVDCDGDGIVDIASDAALVCEVNKETVENGGSLAPAIVNLVESIRTRTSLELAVAARDEIVQKVTPDVYQSVALQSSNKLNYLVTFRCPVTLAGKRFPVKLTAKGVNPQISTGAMVVCRSVDKSEKDDELLLPFPYEQVLGLIPLVPVSPPPPITEIATSTQAQAQSQAQAQAQASMAAQRQQQPQLAFVHAVHAMRQKAQEEYAMSSFQEPQMPTPALALGGATVLMSIGFGLSMGRQRSRVQPARSRLRRR